MGTKIDSYYMKSKLLNPKGSSWTNGHFVTTKIKNNCRHTARCGSGMAGNVMTFHQNGNLQLT